MLERISPRAAVMPAAVAVTVTVAIWPLATVKAVALPITAPAEFANVTVPVQEGAAAVVDDGAGAILTTLTAAVSEGARPTGGNT